MSSSRALHYQSPRTARQLRIDANHSTCENIAEKVNPQVLPSSATGGGEEYGHTREYIFFAKLGVRCVLINTGDVRVTGIDQCNIRRAQWGMF